ncbi:MAG: SAP domain-containing protein [Candidatus Thalassarchaeaceae archaeon]
MSKDDHDLIDEETLSNMTVVDLREMCKNLQLMVSGNKSKLIERIIEFKGIEKPEKELEIEQVLLLEDDEEETIVKQNNIGDAVDKLISKTIQSNDDTGKNSPTLNLLDKEEESEILEAEIFVEENSENKIYERAEKDTKEDSASMVITLPSFRNINFNSKAIGAIFAIILLLGATVFFVLNNDNSFSPKPLNYGDEMNFNVEEVRISIVGDDMVQIFRDSSGGILDDACGELQINMIGEGKVSVSKDEQISTDSLGRSGFYTAEKTIEHDLVVDFEGKTWRDINDCGNLGWSMANNILEMNSKSWTELADRDLKRTNTDISFIDIESEETNLQIVTYGLEGLGDLDLLIPILTFPLKPIELNSFFGERTLSEGSTSKNDQDWNSDWEWTVGSEINSKNHGLVYPITIHHTEIGRCIGHANIQIEVKANNPWPVSQEVDILIDKDSSDSDCNFLFSSAAETILPDGRLTIRLVMGETSTSLGNTPIEWGKEYLKPETGEDQPRTSDKKKWTSSMPDESEIRIFNLETAKECLMNNHSTSDAALAIIDGGYLWQSYWKHSDDSTNPEWNISWVDPDDNSGWLILNGNSSSNCKIKSSGNNDKGEIIWNNKAIPDTPSLNLLEQRVLDSDRYPDLYPFIASNQNSWDSGIEIGYRLSVSDDNDLLSIIPVNLGEGQVSIIGSKSWTESGKNHSNYFIMNGETGEMIAWYHLDD